jgi:hypothetical protein
MIKQKQKPSLDWISFNCKEGRGAGVIADSVYRILVKHRPLVATLQETRHSIEAITKKVGPEFVVVGFDICGTALLVQRDVAFRSARRILLGTESWTFHGNEQPRRAIEEAIVLGYRVGSVHMVASPHDNGEREQQYNIGIDRAERYLQAHPRIPDLWIGDWNKTARGEEGSHTPEALARRVGATLYPNHEVVYPMTRGCTTTMSVLNEGGSDHPLLVGTARR